MRKMKRTAVGAAVAALLLSLLSMLNGASPAIAAGCGAPRGGVQKGLAILWEASSTPQQAQQAIAEARYLGANSLSLSFLIYTAGLRGNRVYTGAYTPSQASLRQVITAAKAAHLRVALRPIIDEANIPRPQWRGTIRPTNPNAWFKSYGNVIAPFASLARATCADEFAVGVELNSMNKYTSQWARVAKRVRAAGFRGNLTYAANWDQPVTFGFSARPGVDFYPKFNYGPNVSVAKLTNGMVGAINRFPAKVRRNLVIQEVGFPHSGGKFANPSYWYSQNNNTSKQQATWFAAACNATKRVHGQGIYFWGFGPSGFDFQGRPAEKAARNCFHSRW